MPIGSPRPNRRGRIETVQAAIARQQISRRSPRPNRRGRIETSLAIAAGDVGQAVPPGLTAGGGLKPWSEATPSHAPRRSPRPNRRGRIETGRPAGLRRMPPVPPGLTAGGGLKRERLTVAVPVVTVFPPA